MLKRIIWVFMLLIMTACTILFEDGVEIVLGELTPTAAITEVVTPGEVELTRTEEVVATSELTVTIAPTLEPTETAQPTAEPTTEPTAAPIPFDPTYVVQTGSPVYLDNFAHQTEGCSWQGVAGQVFDANGKPVSNLIVKASGVWNGIEVAGIGVTGMVSGLAYGPGSYEIVLGKKAVNSTAPLFLQVFDQAQTPLTEPIPFTTSSDCKKNLLIINFATK